MIKKILFLVPGRLGDALMTTPALTLLKHLKPEYQIDILAFSPLGNSIYQNNPHLHRQYLVDEALRNAHFFQPYDFVVAAHRDSKIMELLSAITRPVILIDPADQQRSQAYQALSFIQSVFSDDGQKPERLPYQLFPASEDTSHIAALLPPAQKLIGFHLGCHGINKKMSLLPWQRKTGHKKIWPLTNFVLLARELKQRHGDYRIVLTGGTNESHLAEEFMRDIPDAINLVGKTNVLQLAALLQRLSVYVCPDTGPMHVACAMNVPLITFFGPTNMLRTGPYPASEHRQAIQSPDLTKLSHSEVLERLKILLT